jgi:hypothetical protein
MKKIIVVAITKRSAMYVLCRAKNPETKVLFVFTLGRFVSGVGACASVSIIRHKYTAE